MPRALMPMAMPITGMGMRTTITITTTITTAMVTESGDASTLLQLIWLASPALPVGGFSYSEALESAVDAGRVGNEEQAAQWLSDQLALALARSEHAVVARAIDAWQRRDVDGIAALNRWVLSTRESAELRQQTEQMGRSMLEWLKNRESAEAVAALAALAPAPSWPIAFAFAASRSSAAARDALLSFAFGWAENMVQAALKAVPLGQNAGQRVLARLASEIPAAVEHALGLADAERQAFAPMLAILSAQHESQYSRLFRS